MNEKPKGGWPEPEKEKMRPFSEEVAGTVNRASGILREWMKIKSEAAERLARAIRLGDVKLQSEETERLKIAEERIKEAREILEFLRLKKETDERTRKMLGEIIEKAKGKEGGAG